MAPTAPAAGPGPAAEVVGPAWGMTPPVGLWPRALAVHAAGATSRVATPRASAPDATAGTAGRTRASRIPAPIATEAAIVRASSAGAHPGSSRGNAWRITA